MDVIEIFQGYGLKIGSCSQITTFYNERQELKKNAHLPTGWKTKPKIQSGHKSFYVVTGKISDVVVMDLDDMENDHIKKMKEYADESCNLIVKTRKGYHYYFKYDEYFNKVLRKCDLGVPVDIQTTGQCVYCPPTQYKHHETGEVFKYELFDAKGDNKLSEMSKELKDYIIQLRKANDEIKLKEEKQKVDKHKRTVEKKKEKEEFFLKPMSKSVEQKMKLSAISFNAPEIIKNLFDRCYRQEYFEEYSYWQPVGMALYNMYADKDVGFELFKYYSNKAKVNKDSDDKIVKKYNSFKDSSSGYQSGTVFYYAKLGNEEEFKKILATQELALTEVDIVNYVKELRPNIFMWVNDVPYFYNGKYYVSDKNHSELNNYLSCELYDLLKDFFIDIYPLDSKIFNTIRGRLLKLKTHKFKVEVGKTAGDMLRKDVIFDNNPDILPFNNTVYDLKVGQFREFKYDDYVTVTTGYDWVEPTNEELSTINGIIDKILFNPSIKNLFMSILSTGLDGHLSDKFTILTGKGGNGKSLLKSIVKKSLGNFYYKLNNSVLEGSKGGADPNISNMRGKRLVFISEPRSDKSMDNSIIKDLTGEDDTNARLLFSNQTETTLCCSLMMDCNELPSLKTGATNAEKRRFEIIPFDSRFTFFSNEINEAKHIFKANKNYTEKAFKESHKTAMMKILMRYYSEYIKNGKEFPECKEVRDETENYLKQSDELSELLEEIIQPEKKKKTDVKSIYDELPEKMKRNMTCRLFCEKLKKSAYYGDSYNRGDKNKNIKAHLEGYVLKSSKTIDCMVD
jgi:P4 family phage/plasmid primase-like protien